MGKLLTGHYGQPPEAESITLSLKDCFQRLGMKPTDFVSTEEPDIFKKSHGAHGKYLIYLVEPEEVKDLAVWRPGYYLLPLEARDVLNLFNKQELIKGGAGERRPIELECDTAPAEDVLQRVYRWVDESQPLLFQCHCPELLVKLDAPSLIRRRWKVRLTCKKRCQPPLKTEL